MLSLLAEHWVLLIHAFATAAMFGVIWTCQLVHYPLFASVGEAEFAGYERAHMRRITWIVAPMMGLELATAGWLAAFPPAGLAAAGAAWLVWVGAGLVAVNWASTFTTQGPTHVELSRRGKDGVLIARLVRTNWLRTVAWTARMIVVLMMLLIAAAHGGVAATSGPEATGG